MHLWVKKLNMFIFTPSKTIPQVVIITNPSRIKLPISPGQCFLKIYFPQQKEGKIMELKKWPKVNLRGHWSHVSINSIIFATFTFFVSVLLCQSFDSSILNCEGSLTWLLWFSLKSIVYRNSFLKDKILSQVLF